jgi:N-acetylglucosamine-6-phosphate deacetylase
MRSDLLLRDCRPYDAPEGSPRVDVLLRDGRIGEVGAVEPPPGVEVLDAGGRMLAPGLIDIHIHGAGGADVLDATPEALRTMSAALARLGTTSFVATSVMTPAEGSPQLEATAAQVGRELGGARLLGLYLEGPFINVERRGGIQPPSIWAPSREGLDEILARTDGALRLMTVAPEVPGALEVIERLRGAGVMPAFGHSAASYEETRAGIEAGIGHVTHLFNAMNSLHHRAPGPLPAILEAGTIPVEIISDDVHVRRPVVRLAEKLFGSDRVLCVTDAMRTAGLAEGRYNYGGRDFESRGGAARYLDGTLIGTSIPLLEVVRRFRDFTGCPVREAIEAATVRPARELGLDGRVGSLAPGADADLLLLEDDLSLWKVLVGGKVVG